MRLWQLTAGRSKHAYLVDVEAKFRCQRCVNRVDNRILVTLAERNWEIDAISRLSSDDFRPHDFDELSFPKQRSRAKSLPLTRREYRSILVS